MTLIAFHNDAAVQKKYLDRIQTHYELDEIKHGFYWEEGKGCAVGCTVHSSDHLAFERELGIPVQLAMLEDRIFESLSNGGSKEFPRRFLQAIPLGADLTGVFDHFALWLMIDPEHGVLRYTRDGSLQCEAVERVAALFRRRVGGETVARGEWAAADAAAAAAAHYAADAAHYAAAAAARYAAADAAHYAAAAAARYAAAAAAHYADAAAHYAAAAAAAARYRFWRAAAEKLLQLLAAAPVPVAV